jgi:hypothetical protein
MSKSVSDTPKTPRKSRKDSPAIDSKPKDEGKPIEVSKQPEEPITETYKQFDDGLIPADVEIKSLDNRMWWHTYLTPGTDEYSNATKTSLKIWPGISYGHAKVRGCRMLAKVNSIQIIRHAVELSGANGVRRMQHLARIALGKSCRRIVTEVPVTDKEGNTRYEKSTRIEPPTHTEQIHAIKELNKIDGIDMRLGIEKDMFSAEQKRIQKEILEELRDQKKARIEPDDVDTIVGDAESVDIDTLVTLEPQDSEDDAFQVESVG